MKMVEWIFSNRRRLIIISIINAACHTDENTVNMISRAGQEFVTG